MPKFLQDNKLLLSIIGALLTVLGIVLWQAKGRVEAKVDGLECRVTANEKKAVAFDKDIEYIKKKVDEILKEVRK
jgi:hypothetical protein